jgi:hypothetical protein
VASTLRRVSADSSKSAPLLGPRQTRKSTLVRGLGPNPIVDLAREAELLALAAKAGEVEPEDTLLADRLPT